MKKFRIERFEEWFTKKGGENNNRYIINHDGLKILSEKELISEIFHHIDIENDSSVQDYSYYTDKFEPCPYAMVSLYNSFREGSGDCMYITDIENIDLSELLGGETELNIDLYHKEFKKLTFEEIQDMKQEQDEDAWIIWELKLLKI